jgi:hypothetical protein
LANLAATAWVAALLVMEALVAAVLVPLEVTL